MTEQSKNQEKPAFTVAFRGYATDEVNDYLALITKEIDQLQTEIRILKDERDRLRGQADKAQEVLMHAQRTADDIRLDARREAESMLREAENRALRMDADTRGRMKELQLEFDQARRDFDEFLGNARNLAHSFIRKVDEIRG